jgi:hypothetical protein
VENKSKFSPYKGKASNLVGFVRAVLHALALIILSEQANFFFEGLRLLPKSYLLQAHKR